MPWRAVIAEVEGLGGTVTSVSGAGLAAVFGAPEAHEDDPERAVRAGSRMLSAVSAGANADGTEWLSVRIGVETGPAVVGPLWSGATAGYGAVGEVVEAAAALQSAAKAGSVLVGPATKLATEGVFDWGPTEDVSPGPGAKPLLAVYLERPKARRPAPEPRRALAPLSPGRPPGGDFGARRSTAAGHIGEWFCCFRGGGAGVRQDPPGAGMPEAFHGLGRCRHGTVAALAGGPLCLVRLLDPLWPLPAILVRLDRGCPRGGRRGRPPGA